MPSGGQMFKFVLNVDHTYINYADNKKLNRQPLIYGILI